MKSTKTIAALCAATMVFSTMALPVQAKTSKAETEVITMDDTVKPSKSKKSTKAATDEYKDFGKDIKVTIHTQEDLIQAYLYANVMCAKSLQITFAKDFKMWRTNIESEVGVRVCMLEHSILQGNRLYHGKLKSDGETVILEDFGDILTYFTYVYRTGDTDKIPQNYDKLYERLADGVDSCTTDADSIIDVADNVLEWLRVNSKAASGATFTGKIGVSSIRLTFDGKMILNCMGYSYLFMTMMHMAGHTSWLVAGYSPNNVEHMWNVIKVGDEYRYYDVGLIRTNMTYKEIIKDGYKPEIWHLVKGQATSEKNRKPTQTELEANYVDWR